MVTEMKKVLIVDDAAFVRMQLKQLLIDNNYDVVGEAANGKEALDKIRTLNPVKMVSVKLF